jgi:hypothetical protein
MVDHMIEHVPRQLAAAAAVVVAMRLYLPESMTDSTEGDLCGKDGRDVA